MSVDPVTPSIAVPLACTLGANDLDARLADIGALARRALLSHEQVGRTLRLRYALSGASELERLVQLEQECCAFLQFEQRTDADGIQLDITAPVDAGDFAPVLYAHFLDDLSSGSSATAAPCGCATSGSLP